MLKQSCCCFTWQQLSLCVHSESSADRVSQPQKHFSLSVSLFVFLNQSNISLLIFVSVREHVSSRSLYLLAYYFGLFITFIVFLFSTEMFSLISFCPLKMRLSPPPLSLWFLPSLFFLSVSFVSCLNVLLHQLFPFLFHMVCIIFFHPVLPFSPHFTLFPTIPHLHPSTLSELPASLRVFFSYFSHFTHGNFSWRSGTFFNLCSYFQP